MKLLLLTFLLVSALSGCITMPSDPFTTPVSVELGNSLATDAMKQLETLYPPAHTTFNMSQPVTETDSFGTSLVFQMREKGYAVQLINAKEPATVMAGLSTQYTVDKPASNGYANLYRVQLVVGKTTLTRAYSDGNNAAIPAGAWAKME
jgi:hypothetical protein